MNVVINELAVIAPQPEQPAAQVGEQRPLAPEVQPSSSLRSEDLERALRRFTQRKMRLWAA